MKGNQKRYSTNGWDFVSMYRLDVLNHKIAAEKTYPASVTAADENISLTGEFDPWRLKNGGDKANIYVSLPIRSGVYNGMAQKNVSLQDVSFTALVKIHLLADGSPEESEPYAKPSSDGVLEPIVSIVNMSAPPERFQRMEEYIARSLTESWLNAPENRNIWFDLFGTAFIYSLPQATTVCYAYHDKASESGSLFGTLCMTRGRSAAGLPMILPEEAMPVNQNVAFIINPSWPNKG